MKEISLSIRKLQKKYFTSSNFGSHQNQKTFAYRIENKKQCPRTVRPCHTIIHPTVPMEQHPFQLYL